MTQSRQLNTHKKVVECYVKRSQFFSGTCRLRRIPHFQYLVILDNWSSAISDQIPHPHILHIMSNHPHLPLARSLSSWFTWKSYFTPKFPLSNFPSTDLSTSTTLLLGCMFSELSPVPYWDIFSLIVTVPELNIFLPLYCQVLIFLWQHQQGSLEWQLKGFGDSLLRKPCWHGPMSSSSWLWQ